MAKADPASASPLQPTAHVRHGDAVRVRLPAARDKAQRMVTALASEVDGDGGILAWVVPGRTHSDLTVHVRHKLTVDNEADGWWEQVSP